KLEANAELTKDVLGKDLPEQDFAKRMADLVNQRKKHFAEERAKAKRNKPMTQSQLRIYMSNYLKIKTLKKQKIDDKDVPAIGEKVVEVKEEEPVKRTGKRKKQKARKEQTATGKENLNPLIADSLLKTISSASYIVSTGEGGHDFYEIEEVLQEDREKAAISDARTVGLISAGESGNTRYKAKDNRRRPGKQEEPKALVTLDGDGIDWTGHAEDEQENFALMAYSYSGSDTKVTSCSKECEESYAKLKQLYDATEKNNLVMGGAVTLVLCEDAPVYDRFAKVEGMHAVPPPMTRNYMPPKYDFGIDESQFTYGPKQSKTSKSDAKTSDSNSCESNSSVETLESPP
ncbi:hypothetical protein Tco_0970494, partial [Tanacetum coccineum]